MKLFWRDTPQAVFWQIQDIIYRIRSTNKIHLRKSMFEMFQNRNAQRVAYSIFSTRALSEYPYSQVADLMLSCVFSLRRPRICLGVEEPRDAVEGAQSHHELLDKRGSPLAARVSSLARPIS